MKKSIVILLCVLMILPLLLISCKKDDGGEETPEATTTAATTEYDYSKIPDVIEPHERKLVTAPELGMLAYCTYTEKYYVADAKVENNGDITLTSYNPGTTLITVKNSYGEEMSINVTVGLDYNFEKIDINEFEMPEDYVYANKFGMSPDKDNNASALQKAIDSLTDGGVVYIPKGNYKCGFVQLKNDVTLRLEGIIPEYNTEFTDELAERIESGDDFARIIAVDADMFANTARKEYGRNGADNFEITGGVIDMNGKARGFIWCCAENVLLENVIMKDCPNDHAIQVTGSKNVDIRNVMFAGYNAGSNVSGSELIQIETSHPGAIQGYTATKFDENEFYNCENVTVENCYFGRSDRYDSATYFIGHHVHNAAPSVTGLKVKGCTFDDPRVVAIRAYAYADFEISDCKFISDRANSAVSEERYMVELTLNNGSVKLPSGAYLATAETRGGCNNVRIHNNEFVLGEESQIVGFVRTLNMGIVAYDAMGYSNISRAEFYTSTPKSFTGYELVTARISELRIYDNMFTVQNDANETLFYLNGVRGMELKGNTFDMWGELIEDEDDYGVYSEKSTSMEDYKRNFVIGAVSANSSVPIVLETPDDEIEAYCTASDKSRVYTLTVVCDEGGVIERRVDEDGVLYVTPVAEKGYEFAGYSVDGDTVDGGSFGFKEATVIKAIFVKK